MANDEELFADNLSDISSESEDIDHCEDDIESERNEKEDSDSDKVILSEREKIIILSDSEPENLNNSPRDFERNFRFGCQDDDWSKEDIRPNSTGISMTKQTRLNLRADYLKFDSCSIIYVKSVTET